MRHGTSEGGARIVVRAFNEAPRLGPVLAALVSAGHRVIVVDDGSEDGTAALARSFPVALVRHAVNLGPGAAFQTGLEAALAEGADPIATFDADGQHDVADLERILAPVRAGEADVAFGSRFLRPQDRALVPPARRLLLRGAVEVNALFTGRRLSDAHNGLRALSAAVARTIRIEEPGFAYATDLLAQIARGDWRLVEIPVAIRYTPASLAKGQRGWNAINVVLDLIGGRLLR